MRKMISIILCAVLCVGAVVVPASAATVNGYTVIDYNDYISNVKADGDNDLVTVSLPAYMYGWTKKDASGYYRTEGVPLGKLDCKLNDGIIDNAGVFYPAADINKTYMDLTNIPDGSVFKTTNKVWIEPENVDPNGIFDVRYRSRVAYYDINFKLIKNDTSPIEELLYVPNAWVYDMQYEVEINKPENAMYCATYFFFEVLSVPYSGAVSSVWFDFDIPKLEMSISSLYRLQEQTGKTNELLEELPEEIGDQFRDVIQEEQDKAEMEGNSSVGQLEAVIPDHSAGFMDALQGFAESMSYTGTEAKIKIPDITLPEIAGLIPEYQILESTTLDFGEYIRLIPEAVMLLVQSLLTIALIIYCFKELYDTISYVLTLRRSADG